LTFSELDVRFLAPVFIGDTVRLEAEAPVDRNGVLKFHAVWVGEADGESRIEASGALRLGTRSSSPTASADGGQCLLTDEISQASYVIDELDARSESLRFSLEPAVLSHFQTSLFRPALGRDDYGFCPNLAASLLLSTLVGMRLPGRYATFSSFKASFEKALLLAVPGSLTGSVEKVARAGESISVSASFIQAGQRVGSAQLKVLVSPPPRTMISCAAIKERYLEVGVRDKVAVITGSSRGIGETTAKLFAMHGARTGPRAERPWL
jgi:hypothetical protein